MRTRHFPILLFLVAIAICSDKASAQSPWPMPDSEWNFVFGGPPYFGYNRYYVNGTETIQGKSCTRIFVDQYYLSNFSEGTEPFKLLHFDGDTLWHYVESDVAFYPLVCFNAEPGDTWFPYDTLNGDPTCSFSPMEVTDTFSVYHDGQAFRGVTIETEQNGYLWWGGSFNERTYMDTSTFSNGSPFFSYYQPFPEYNGCDGIIIDWFSNSLLCYHDNELDITVENISLIEGQEDCDYPWNLVSISEAALAENILAYPNPANNQVHIDLGSANETITIRVYNSSGELVRKDELRVDGTIDYVLPNPKGVYLIQLVQSDGKVNNLKILKE